MQRLDSMSELELETLYDRSNYLFLWGVFLFCVSIFLLLSAVCCLAEWGGGAFLFSLTAVLFVFARSYVFLYVRNESARVYFRVSSVLGMVSLALPLPFMFYFKNIDWIYVIPATIVFLIQVGILKATKIDALFGADGFTHKQIALARKKKKKGESFADEDILAKRPNKKLADVCVALSFFWEMLFALLLLSKIINFFESSLPR